MRDGVINIFSTGPVGFAPRIQAKDIQLPPGSFLVSTRLPGEEKRVQAIWEAVRHLDTAPRLPGYIPHWLMKNRRWLRVNRRLLRLGVENEC